MPTNLNIWRLVFQHLNRECGMTRRAMSQSLAQIQERSEGAIAGIPTSQATLTRLINGQISHFGNHVNDLLFLLLDKHDALGGFEDFDTLIIALSQDAELRAYTRERKHSPKAQSRVLVPSWKNLSYLFGVWQTINLSTFSDFQMQRDAKEIVPDVRLGLRIVGPHREATPDRLRMHTCEIGPSTIWDGSSDMLDGYMYTRLREISGGKHIGERIFATIKLPPPYNHLAQKESHEFYGVGVTQVMVRGSSYLPSHIFCGISILRYMPELSGAYYEAITDNSCERFIEDAGNLRPVFCERTPVEEFLKNINNPENINRIVYRKIARFIDMIRHPSQRLRVEKVADGSTAYFY